MYFRGNSKTPNIRALGGKRVYISQRCVQAKNSGLDIPFFLYNVSYIGTPTEPGTPIKGPV